MASNVEMWISRNIRILIFLYLALQISAASAQSDSTTQPAGMIASLEFTDISKTPAGDGILGRKAWLGVYYKFTESLTGIAVAAYGQNDLNGGGDITMREAKATITWDILEVKHPFVGALFLVGAVGNSWTDVSSGDGGTMSAFLESTGIGFKIKNGPGIVAAHIRIDKSKNYQQTVVGIDYAIPFDIK